MPRRPPAPPAPGRAATRVAIVLAAVLALALPGEGVRAGQATQAAGDWTRWKYDAGNTEVNPSESRLGPGNVRGLHRSWFRSLCCGGGTPLVAGGGVYLGAEEGGPDGPGVVDALDAATGRRRWAGLVQGIGEDATSTAPVIANGVVYTSVLGDHVQAFPSAGCGASTCRPLWNGVINPEENTSTAQDPPSVTGGAVYVTAWPAGVTRFAVPSFPG